MTKEKNIDTVEENTPIAENTTEMSGASIPPVGENSAAVNNTPEKNSLAVQEENYPAAQNTAENTLNVAQEIDPATMTVAQLEAHQYQHGLNVRQQEELDKKRAAENNNTGNLSQKVNDKNYEPEVKPYQLKEGDIIEEMYKGFIDDLMSVDAWARKHVYRWFDNALYGIDNKKARNQQQNNSQNTNNQGNTSNSNSNQNTSNSDDKPSVLDKAYTENYEKIKNETDKELSTLKDISEAIKDGTLFNENNKDLLADFQRVAQNDSEHGKKTYEAVKKVCEEQDKKDNKADREKMAKEFFAYNGGAVWFNFSNQSTANNLAYAEMSHRSKHENMNAQKIEQEFAQTRTAYHDRIQSTTAKEQQDAKEKISTSPILDKKVLSKISISDLYADASSKTQGMKRMGEKAVEYAELNADISDRNPYTSHLRHRMGMPEISTKDRAFRGGTLQDGVNYMRELRTEALQTTSPLQNQDLYHREILRKHIEKIKNTDSNEEILKQLRNKNQGGRE